MSKVPVLLECAGPLSGKAERGHRRQQQDNLFILWKFDPVINEWRELGRSHSDSWTWAIDLRPLAIRALEESRGHQVEVSEGFDDAINRIRAWLKDELSKLPEPDRGRAIAILHDELAASYALFL